MWVPCPAGIRPTDVSGLHVCRHRLSSPYQRPLRALLRWSNPLRSHLERGMTIGSFLCRQTHGLTSLLLPIHGSNTNGPGCSQRRCRSAPPIRAEGITTAMEGTVSDLEPISVRRPVMSMRVTCPREPVAAETWASSGCWAPAISATTGRSKPSWHASAQTIPTPSSTPCAWGRNG